MPYSALLVGGSAQERRALSSGLKTELDVAACALARESLERLRGPQPPHLLLLDADLGDMDSQTFLRVLRDSEAGRSLPVILMSGSRAEADVVRAFELGVDDHLAKPFDLRELLVRARAVLRRRYERLEHFGSPLSVGPVSIDPSQRLCLVAGKRIRLQPREFELLEMLMRKSGRVLSRVYLLETVWGMSATAQTRAVDVMVSRLRRRLGAKGARLIETVSKLGYCLRA